MLRPFIPDKEITLSQDNDLLKTGVYAENLASVINATPKNEVTTIGVFGSWGTGKSSVVRTVIAAEWMYHPYHFEMYQS